MTKTEIIENILLDHGRHPDDAGAVEEGLAALEKADAAAAARMKDVIGLWDRARRGLPIRYDVLPDGLPDTAGLCLAVLGYRLQNDGGMTKELVGRLTVALRSAEKYKNAYILCSGGGTAEDLPNLTEAGQMAAWLTEKGVDRKRIIVEDRSRSTGQNAVFSCELLVKNYPFITKLAVITSDYHIVGGTVAFRAASLLSSGARRPCPAVVSNAAWRAPAGSFPPLFQAYALTEVCRLLPPGADK